MGKSTLLSRQAQAHPEYRVYREGDYCPVEFAWCAYMTEKEYRNAVRRFPALEEELARWTVTEKDRYNPEKDRYFVMYTRIITDEPGFHKYMEEFEIYGGRKSTEEFTKIILERYENLPIEEETFLFEGAFFQNIMKELLVFHLLTDEQILSFYRQLFYVICKRVGQNSGDEDFGRVQNSFRLWYLYDEDVEAVITHICKERSDVQGNPMWYPLMLRYLQGSPYGKVHGVKDFTDVIAYFCHKQQLELRVIREILGECAVIRPAKERRLTRGFFTRDGITVARELLGKMLVHETPIGTIRGIITEVECYMGEEDKGSHTYGGKRTERTEPMYHVGGTSYVYLIYGMYSCMNVTCMTEGIPQAVLLRSVVPADEESRRLMTDLRLEPLNRKRIKAGKIPYSAVDNEDGHDRDAVPRSLKKHLADGPGKMCIAMNISRAHNDLDMVESEKFYFTEGIEVCPEQIKEGKRIGIDYAEEAADYLWRFYIDL